MPGTVEDGNVDWDLVEEDPEATADGSPVVARGREDKADAWRNVDAFGGEAVVIEPQAKIQGQARMNLPVVLHEEREVVLPRSCEASAPA